MKVTNIPLLNATLTEKGLDVFLIVRFKLNEEQEFIYAELWLATNEDAQKAVAASNVLDGQASLAFSLRELFEQANKADNLNRILGSVDFEPDIN